MSTPDIETAVELAQLRTELHSTNSNIKRIADSLDYALKDHEQRIRALEAAKQSQAGVVGFARWVGAPTLVLAGALLFNRVNGGS